MCIQTVLYNRCGHVAHREWDLCRRFVRNYENTCLEPCTNTAFDEWFDEDYCRDCEARRTRVSEERARGQTGPATAVQDNNAGAATVQMGVVGGDADFECRRREAHPWRIVVRVERVEAGAEAAADKGEGKGKSEGE